MLNFLGWVSRDLIIGLGIGIALLLIYRYWRDRKQSSIANLYDADQREADIAMLDAAIAKGLDEPQTSYLRYLGWKLKSLEQDSKQALKQAQLFGLIALMGSPLSSLVTGAKVSALGLPPESLSFWITSISSVAGAIAAFFQFSERASHAKQIASQIRAKIYQFIAGSLEFKRLAIAESFQLLTDTLEQLFAAAVDPMLGQSTAPNAELPSPPTQDEQDSSDRDSR